MISFTDFVFNGITHLSQHIESILRSLEGRKSHKGLQTNFKKYMYISQRKFIPETPDSLAVDLHKTFATWVNENGFSAPTEEDWNTIMEEDGRCLW